MKRLLVSLILALSLAIPATAQVVEDPSGGGASSGSTVAGCSAITAILNVVSGTLTCNPASVVNGTLSTAGRSIVTIRDTISGSSTSSNFLSLSGMLPASTSTNQYFAYFNLKTSASDSPVGFGRYGLRLEMSPETAGSGKTDRATVGYYVLNSTETTATTLQRATIGLQGAAQSVSSGTTLAVGVRGETAGTGSIGNVGVLGTVGSGGAPPVGIGVLGGATQGTVNVGGYFQIGTIDESLPSPGTSAALVANNRDASNDIFRALDNGSAVFTIGDGGAITGTGAYLFPAGAASAASVAVGEAGVGLYRRTGGVLSISNGSGGVFEFNASDLFGISTGRIGFTNGALNGTLDTLFRRGGAAATMQMGNDINGAPTDQVLQAHNGITGTDVKGAALNLRPGLGTGAAVSNPLTLNRVVTKATGTTAQTYSPSFVACPTKILSNTSATTQTVATITTTSTTGGSVTMDYSVVANNGTLQNVDGGMVKVAWGNNAGTVTSTMTAVALQADADASGTLAATPTRTDATNVISIKLTPTWVTIVPTTVTAWITFTLHTSGDTVACQ